VFIYLLFLSIALGLASSLAIEHRTTQILLQLTVFSVILLGYFRMFKQPIFSHDLFREQIKEELRLHYERNKSRLIYEMEPGGYDLCVIKK
jgi:hypothetical protein